ncbi:hypothetical protein [Sphingobacterium cavernae]|uniref:hypothetical protein n=1 Tax=Sphingobacterium cavernae TaxID=2592657 RepID=UPI00122FE8E9|nr:hypothetical protein [Sphingobacterium cavernae]
MKKNKLLFASAFLLWLLYINIPQLRGTVYLSGDTNKPKDWLSALNLKFKSNENFEIPKNITTIYLKGTGHDFENKYSEIKISNKTKDNGTITYKDNNVNFSVQNDTLIIHLKNSRNNELHILINNTIKCIVADNIKAKELLIDNTLPLEYILGNKSSLDINYSNTAVPLKFKIEDKSAIGFSINSASSIDMQIINSMAYIRPNSNIDSLNVNLIEKSNIIFQDEYTREMYNTYNGLIVGSGSSTTGGNAPLPNKLIINGNLKYYNLAKDKYKFPHPPSIEQDVITK